MIDGVLRPERSTAYVNLGKFDSALYYQKQAREFGAPNLKERIQQRRIQNLIPGIVALLIALLGSLL